VSFALKPLRNRRVRGVGWEGGVLPSEMTQPTHVERAGLWNPIPSRDVHGPTSRCCRPPPLHSTATHLTTAAADRPAVGRTSGDVAGARSHMATTPGVRSADHAGARARLLQEFILFFIQALVLSVFPVLLPCSFHVF
jgi:hypothetical protein